MSTDITTFYQTDPSADPVEEVMRRVEEVINEDGWDQEACFYLMRWINHSGRAALELITFLVPESVTMDPGVNLPQFVDFLVHHGLEGKGLKPGVVRAGYEVFLRAGFYGVVMFNEGWRLPSDLPEEEFKRTYQTRTVHLHPKRIEERLGTVVTTDGRIAMIKRTRGEEAEYQEQDPTPDRFFGGRVPDSLRRLCDHLENMAKAIGAPTNYSWDDFSPNLPNNN